MVRSIRSYKNIITILFLFFFSEYLRVFGDGLIDKAADNLLFAVIAIVWAVHLRRRIIDERTRKILIGLAMSLVALFVVRTCKYAIFDKNTILWYMYYIPFTAMPLLTFFMSKADAGNKKKSKASADKWLLVILCLINVMILTNDLHELVFRFTEPGNIDKYKYGTGYFVTLVWIVIFTFATLFNLYKTCALPQSKNKIWVLSIPIVVGIALIVISTVHLTPIANDTPLYQFHEIVMMMIVSIVEACIQIGIIPSNDGYEEIFANSKVNACIADESNYVQYSSDTDNLISEDKRMDAHNEKVMIDDYTRLRFNKINGGNVYYTEDIRDIVRINHMLEEAAEVISGEKEMIEAENQLLAEETMYKTKNKLYDDFAKTVRPQVLVIEECLSGCEREPERYSTYISKAAVLNAYIKRRINLALLAMEENQISLAELNLALSESLIYLKYSEIDTSISNHTKDGSLDAKLCIAIYDYFEAIIEAYYENMSAFMATIDEKENQYVIRFTIETSKGSGLLPAFTYKQDIYEDEDMLSITIPLLKGGDAV